jgi:hypothetical protein
VRHDPSVSAAADRTQFERAVAELVGRRITAVRYWDIHNASAEPRTWDHGEWHHAVMGVELTTEAGPRSVLGTATFWEYGVEVIADPITKHLLLSDEGPEGWPAGDHPLWRAREGQPITNASTFWERMEIGPARRSDGTIASPARNVEVPVGLRLDFDAGPVWFVAGIPQYPDTEQTFVPGDEIMVVFTLGKMRRIGFPDGDFLRPA